MNSIDVRNCKECGLTPTITSPSPGDPWFRVQCQTNAVHGRAIGDSIELAIDRWNDVQKPPQFDPTAN